MSFPQSYTLEMLKTDYSMAFCMFFFGISSVFAPIVAALPDDHPLWGLFKIALPRCVMAMKLTGFGKLTIDTCKRLGLEVDEAIPWYTTCTHSRFTQHLNSSCSQ